MEGEGGWRNKEETRKVNEGPREEDKKTAARINLLKSRDPFEAIFFFVMFPSGCYTEVVFFLPRSEKKKF